MWGSNPINVRWGSEGPTYGSNPIMNRNMGPVYGSNPTMSRNMGPAYSSNGIINDLTGLATAGTPYLSLLM